LHISDEAKDFVSTILQIDPQRRPSAQDLLQHDFLKGPVQDVFAHSVKTTPALRAPSPRVSTGARVAASHRDGPRLFESPHEIGRAASAKDAVRDRAPSPFVAHAYTQKDLAATPVPLRASMRRSETPRKKQFDEEIELRPSRHRVAAPPVTPQNKIEVRAPRTERVRRAKTAPFRPASLVGETLPQNCVVRYAFNAKEHRLHYILLNGTIGAIYAP
jgi:serine/threonine protein kinase